ncbi:MAG: 50S ribosomal protein L18 [Planctomycetota bacterium]
MDRNKKSTARRLRRRRHIRRTLAGTTDRPRLTVTRSLKHIYCQLIDDTKGVTIAAASSRSPEIRDSLGNKGGNREGAKLVGELVAKKAQELGIRKLAFDRNGYRYHGRVAAVAAAVREGGIEV